MLLRPRNPAHADDLLGRWFAQRSEQWWQTHWKLAVYQGLILVFVMLIGAPVHDLFRFPWGPFCQAIHDLGIGSHFQLLISGLLTLARFALPTTAAISLLTFIQPHPILCSSIAPGALRRRLLGATRNTFFCWLGLGAIIPIDLVNLGKSIISDHTRLSFTAGVPLHVVSMVVACFFYTELATAVFTWFRPRRFTLTAFLIMVPFASWGMRELAILVVNWLQPIQHQFVEYEYQGQLWKYIPIEVQGLAFFLLAALIRMLPAFLLFIVNRYPNLWRFKATPLPQAAQ